MTFLSFQHLAGDVGSGGRERSHLCARHKILKNKRLSFVDPWVMPQWCGIILCRTVLLRKRTKGLPETSLFHRYIGHGYDTSDRILRNSSSRSRGASMARQDRRKPCTHRRCSRRRNRVQTLIGAQRPVWSRVVATMIISKTDCPSKFARTISSLLNLIALRRPATSSKASAPVRIRTPC